MMEDSSKKIISLYFGKHFSERARKLFSRWLNATDGEEEKSEAMQELWNQNSAVSDESTQTDWEKLNKRLYFIPAHKNKTPFRKQFMKYAAVIALMILSAVTATYFTHKTIISSSTEMAEFFVPYGESKVLTLPDSSRVWVDAGSVLIYPKDFSNMKTRPIYLNGKASFKVKKNKEQPFIVKTNCLQIQALGTVFTVNSYPSDSFTTATLEEGKVLVSVNGSFLQPAVLKPNQQYVYSNKNHTATIQTVDAALYAMERQGFLIFEHVSFDQLMSSLERRFNVVIQYNSQKYGKENYNVKFGPQESIHDVMGVVQQLIGIQYKIKGNVIIIN